WRWFFSFPEGAGYYEFHTNATDAATNEEIDTGTDTTCGYDVVSPIADAGFDISIDEDEQFQLDGSGSTDNLEIVNWTWDFGDGTMISGDTASYTFLRSSVYVVILTVRDIADNEDKDTLTVFVNNIAPTAEAGGDQTVDENETVTFDGSGSMDTPSDSSTLRYTWYFDDGVVLSGITVSRTFTEEGDYAVVLVVEDDNGFADSDTLNVKVNNVPEEPTPVPEPETDWFSILLLALVILLIFLFLLHLFLESKRRKEGSAEDLPDESLTPAPIMPLSEAEAPVDVMKFCPSCGQDIEPGFIACPICGMDLNTPISD
ncbi:MAG: PKD domain-containing protein, partial [Thermoplasmata archaeon]|nr:PKD domain-containing protein [Thermoplasmata archaeon]